MLIVSALPSYNGDLQFTMMSVPVLHALLQYGEVLHALMIQISMDVRCSNSCSRCSKVKPCSHVMRESKRNMPPRPTRPCSEALLQRMSRPTGSKYVNSTCSEAYSM